MDPDQLHELMRDMASGHQKRVEQMVNLLSSAGGQDVFELTEKVIGPGISAVKWLTSRQIGLGAVPAVVALEPEGRERVITYLTQIDYGVYI